MTAERDVGWLEHRSTEHNEELLEHPAVVLRVLDGRSLLVIHGTSRARNRSGEALQEHEVPPAPDDRCFFVEPTSPDGERLGLTKRTFFHRRAVTVCPTAAIRVTHTCSPALYLQLRRIAGFTA
jgi:hypothetical protein